MYINYSVHEARKRKFSFELFYTHALPAFWTYQVKVDSLVSPTGLR